MHAIPLPSTRLVIPNLSFIEIDTVSPTPLMRVAGESTWSLRTVEMYAYNSERRSASLCRVGPILGAVNDVDDHLGLRSWHWFASTITATPSGIRVGVRVPLR